MEIIYINDDPEVKRLIKLMGTIACFEILRSKDLITDEELEKLKKSAMSDYDVDALTKYFNKKNQNKKGDKNGFSKEESSKC